MKGRLLVFGALIWLPALAHAEGPGFRSGNDLYLLCTSANSRDEMWCINYVMGATDALLSVLSVLMPAGMPYCIPAGATTVQLKDVVVRFMDDYPHVRHMPGGDIVQLAYRRAFPCAGDQQPHPLP